MDFTNFSLDNLKFELKRKQEELLNETIEVLLTILIFQFLQKKFKSYKQKSTRGRASK